MSMKPDVVDFLENPAYMLLLENGSLPKKVRDFSCRFFSNYVPGYISVFFETDTEFESEREMIMTSEDSFEYCLSELNKVYNAPDRIEDFVFEGKEYLQLIYCRGNCKIVVQKGNKGDKLVFEAVYNKKYRFLEHVPVDEFYKDLLIGNKRYSERNIFTNVGEQKDGVELIEKGLNSGVFMLKNGFNLPVEYSDGTISEEVILREFSESNVVDLLTITTAIAPKKHSLILKTKKSDGSYRRREIVKNPAKISKLKIVGDSIDKLVKYAEVNLNCKINNCTVNENGDFIGKFCDSLLCDKAFKIKDGNIKELILRGVVILIDRDV